MFFILLLLLLGCEYYFYTRQHYRLCLATGSLFFLWYDWSTRLSIFTFTHEPILLPSNAAMDPNSAAQTILGAPNGALEPIPHAMVPLPSPAIGTQHRHAPAATSSSQPFALPTLLSNQTNLTIDDLALIQHQKNLIVVNAHRPKFDRVSTWQILMNKTSLWEDIDYSAGCAARAANWPARDHLERVEIMAARWYDDQENQHHLLDQIHAALDYWFQHDFAEPDCLMSGGVAYKNCPCGTPGLWMPNWYNQVIAVPRFVGNICLLVRGSLTTWEQEQCIKFTRRSYTMVEQHGGTNLLDVVYNGVSWALLIDAPEWAADAFERASRDLVLALPGEDGLQVDGSYMYHDRQLYTGNYGDTYMGDWVVLLDMMHVAKHAWKPSDDAWNALTTLVTGSEWQMVAHPPTKKKPDNMLTANWLWQYSTLSRMISTASHDAQNSAGVVMNITELAGMYEAWHKDANATSHYYKSVETMASRLKRPYTSANQGTLTGTRHFWQADYLVHRGLGFVVTLKMLSSRTTTAECLNGQNLLGSHLNDGAIFVYRAGDDYVDVFGAWHWHRLPGVSIPASTREPNMAAAKAAQHTGCHDGNARFQGKQAFVGAAVLQDQQLGTAVMHYTDPRDPSISYKKTYFFFPSMYAVDIDITSFIEIPVVNNATNATNSANGTTMNVPMPLVTTLDQRRRANRAKRIPGSDDTWIDGQKQSESRRYANASTVWHDRTLYRFEEPTNVDLEVGVRASHWPAIGISDDHAPVDMWQAAVEHADALTYTVYPNVMQPTSTSPHKLDFIRMQGVRGALNKQEKALALAFWEPASISVPWEHGDDGDDGTDVFIEALDPVVLVLQQQIGNGSWILAVADPTQTLTQTTLRVSVDQEESMQDLIIKFPTGVRAGSTVIHEIQDEP
ncbi:chondroitin AC/alginate lyase [Gongronella butleri]|nr:chondroitin AC/alginate lyase [Gongronella butleri]